MLFNFDHTQSLFLIGQGITSKEFNKILCNHGIRDTVSVTIEMLESMPDNVQCIIAMRDVSSRQQIIKKFQNKFSWPSFVNKNSEVVDFDKLGAGIWIDSFSAVGSDAVLSDFSVVSQYCCVSHNCWIGENCFFAPGTIILGSTKVGNNVYFGAKTTVLDNLCIASDTTFAAGSMIHKDVVLPGKYVHNRKIS